MSKYSRVRAGQAFRMPAEIYNRMLDVIEHVDELRMVGRGRVSAGSRDRGLVLVKNESEYDCGRFGVLGIDGIAAVSDPANSVIGFQNEHVVSGKLPTSSHLGKFVVLAEAVRSGAVGWGVASGVTPARIEFLYGSEPYADIRPNDRSQLKASEGGGAEILWKESGTLTKWALVRLGQPTYPTLFGKLDAALSAGSSAEMSVWDSYSIADSGRNVTVYDWMLASGKKLAGGGKIVAEYRAGKWYVVQAADCPVDA